MLNKPDSCKSCVGWSWGHSGFVPADGTGDNGCLVILEAAGADEEIAGMSTVGAAGQFLWNALHRIGIEREGFRCHNVLSCRPPNNKLTKMPYEAAAINHCAPNLDTTITQHVEHCKSVNKTPVIIALGKIAFKRLMGVTERDLIMKKDYIAYPFWLQKYSSWLIAGYHPSYLMQGSQHLTPILTYVFQRALEIASNGIILDNVEGSYLEDPEAATFDSWIKDYFWQLNRNPDTFLSYDIETPYKEGKDEAAITISDDQTPILRCSFSYRPGSGVSVPWKANYFPALARLFASVGPKVGWNNSQFDAPKIREYFPIAGDDIDAMLAWHVLNTSFPKALGFVTPFYAQTMSMWKHLDKDRPAFYNCLHGESRLVAWDGTTHRIEDVVRHKKALILRGMDEHDNAIPVKVVGWHKQIQRGQIWLKVKADGVRQPIICTPDHQIWTAGGWREAGKLKVGSWIKSPRFGSTELIHGALLGDSSVDKRGQLSICHGVRQVEYFWLKHKNLSASAASEFTGGYGSQCISAGAWIPKFWRKTFYPYDKKIFIAPKSDAALAIWYCDDGCLAEKKTPRLAIYFDNNDVALNWLEDRFAPVAQYNINEKGFVAAIKNREEFFSRIAPYVPTCMDYKLPEEYKGQYNGWLDTPIPQDTLVVSIEPYTAKSRGQIGVRYCVTVDHPTHRFMTLGGLVKNCCDADAALRCWLGIREDLKRNNLWGVFNRHVIDVHRVYRFMSDKGVLLDQQLRRESEIKLAAMLADIEVKMADAIPLQARRLKIYKKTPKDTAGMLQVEQLMPVKRCSICGLESPKKAHFKPVSVRKRKAGLDNVCEDAVVLTTSERVALWAKPLEWKVSKLGLSSYQGVVKHASIFDRRKGRTTYDESAMMRLMKKYPSDKLYPLILDHREKQKLLSVYIGVTQYKQVEVPNDYTLKDGEKFVED